MKKLILHCGLSLGDIVMLTAAVRDLHRCHPGRFATDVRTSCSEVWDNNPNVTPLADEAADVEHIDCSYPLINDANRVPYHCLHGFIDFLNKKLGLAVRPTEFKGDICLSAQEKAWYSQVREVTDREIPFWIIAAGGKHDVTIKWWATERYQQVVDALHGKVQFVQIGGDGHHHSKLDGVIDLRGQTSVRELIRLVYHAEGVLCSVTGLMHLAAAVESKNRHSPLRPCVVIAGGREPAQWEQYPGHQFIHTIGALPCCLHGGCWKDRTLPLRDGDNRDRPENLCNNVAGDLPKCMDMIQPAEVVSRILMYHDGGASRYLSPVDFQAAKKGVHATESNPIDQAPLNIHEAGLACDRAIDAELPSEPQWQGRGIVICAGGIRYFTNAWVCIHMLRHLGCGLPIEVWHRGEKELSRTMAALLEPLGVKVVDALEVVKQHPMRRLNGWEMKPYAIIHSSFSEVLFLDADNVPVVNPEYLFETAEFKSTGAMFWPDFNFTPENDQLAIWRSCGLRRPSEREFETGQVLVDKKKCWRALNLCLWFNENSDFYYRHMHGDKETFHLAFRKVWKSYFLIPHPIVPLEGTMCQHDPSGHRLFQHRNMAKWDLVTNRRIRDFWLEDECLGYISKLKSLWDAGVRSHEWRKVTRRPLKKPPVMAAVVFDSPGGMESRQLLARLADTDWDHNRVYARSGNCGGDQWREVFQKALQSSIDYILIVAGNFQFNRHLESNLAHWAPLRDRVTHFGSVFNPSLRETAFDFRRHTRIVTERQWIGPEGLLLSRHVAELLLEKYARISSFAALDFSKLAAKMRTPLFVHAPSLAQRLENVTKGGRRYHPAVDFDPDWRAPGGK